MPASNNRGKGDGLSKDSKGIPPIDSMNDKGSQGGGSGPNRSTSKGAAKHNNITLMNASNSNQATTDNSILKNQPPDFLNGP